MIHRSTRNLGEDRGGLCVLLNNNLLLLNYNLKTEIQLFSFRSLSQLFFNEISNLTPIDYTQSVQSTFFQTSIDRALAKLVYNVFSFSLDYSNCLWSSNPSSFSSLDLSSNPEIRYRHSVWSSHLSQYISLSIDRPDSELRLSTLCDATQYPPYCPPV